MVGTVEQASHTLADPYVIRPLTSQAEYRVCEDIQIAVWGLSERECVPWSQFMAVQRHGGLVLGAFSPEGELVGFVYGFLSRELERWAFYSDLMAVLPAHRGHRLGYYLKLVQREHILARGLDLIVWTYDPLEAINARLNLNRLGGIARQYEVDYWGDFGGQLTQGLETDRLLCEWHLRSQRVKERLRGMLDAVSAPLEACPSMKPLKKRSSEVCPRADLRTRGRVRELFSAASSIIQTEADPSGQFRIATDLDTGRQDDRLLLEIPANIQTVKRISMSQAQTWRRITRQAFQTYFRRGYVAVDCLIQGSGAARRVFYMLERKDNAH